MRMKFKTKKEYIIHYLIGLITFVSIGIITSILKVNWIFLLYWIGAFLIFCIIDYIQYILEEKNQD